ncbi:MAG: hypothetical protein WDO73_11730 [Ignavibacteriota bacterium]
MTWHTSLCRLPRRHLVQFLAQPPGSPEEWQARSKTLVPNPAQQAIGNLALAYALLVGKEFAAAQPLLQSMYDNGSVPVDEALPILLAWADVETAVQVIMETKLFGGSRPSGLSAEEEKTA